MRTRALLCILCCMALMSTTACATATPPTSSSAAVTRAPNTSGGTSSTSASRAAPGAAHFSLSVPTNWTVTAVAPSTLGSAPGVTSEGIELSSPSFTGGPYQLEITDYAHIPVDQLQSGYCSTTGTTAVTYAGLPMRYSVAEGVYRTWQFVNSQGTSYFLSAMDATQPSSVQQANDAILATFKPDEATPGCPA